MDEASYLSKTRASYDALAEWYVEFVRHELEGFPLARAHLAMFAELVTRAGEDPSSTPGADPAGSVATSPASGSTCTASTCLRR